MPYIKEIITLILSSFTFVYILSILSFHTTYKNILYYPTPNGENLLGHIGSYVASISFFILGKTAYILIIPLFLIIFALVFDKKKLIIYSRNILIILFLISGFIGLFSKEFYGGIIGGISGILFRELFGFVGTLLILILLTLAALSLISEKIKRSIINPKIMMFYIINKIFLHNINKNQSNTDNHTNYEERKEENKNIIEIKEYCFEQEKPVKKENDLLDKGIYSNNYQEREENYIEYLNIKSETKSNIDSKVDRLLEENIHNNKTDEEKIKNQDQEKKDLTGFSDKINRELEENNYEINGIDDKHEITDKIDNSDNKDIFINNIKEDNKNIESILTKDFKFPEISLLKDSPKNYKKDEEEEKITVGLKLVEVLKEFNIEVTLENIVSGPVITRYEIVPPKGLKLSKIISLEDNISLGLASHEKIRIEAPVPGKKVVGIEVPNKYRALITLKDMLNDPEFKPENMAIPFTLGKDITGKSHYTDISKIPHLLIAGSTGSGKSVCLNSLITTILYTKKPDEVKLILVDPKRVELKLYEGIPHLITPVIKELSDAINMLNWAVSYMEERYKILESCNVRNIKTYNLINKEKMPYILIIIDEFADFIITGKKEIEDPIIRLAAMARAVGIHLVLATQRPSADIITNLIKANFPGRIAFKVATKLESRIILDINGAEKLLGKGDMLYASPNSLSIKRLQSPLISDEEVNAVTNYYRNNYSPIYWDIIEETEKEASSPTDEPLFNEAVNIILRDRKASASYLQRRLKIGYNRAARIIEMMEDMGIISPSYSGKREILIESWNEI
ncbi:MAG TPA: DNA translocase FtsK [Spirochaetota bacterium]|nr:DNA translocase FtsK [Spirochaetota bacterium]HOM38010.1 DNA translocase FtsK [Spirochaetota bacterium]HPQ48814.1 DNA translocase FtsK [Spirochaetota bacterium]